ncbi:hypothetical protein LTR36_006563 [Oleoguttula mirabilis]|uniref:Glycine zipper 2TM domain-containing protein n=1 Tax=Oleoguttula mirabilis TaxID=1507867 RepID=A0AAV9JV63_9PEZI|nr:hypothetical protein LTR36_006563 [Oleoguttula mirabilis]
MAAAEYYGSGGGLLQPAQQPPRPQQPSRPQQPPRPQQQSQQTLAPLPYPISDEPPPYSTLERPQSHSQPPPHSRQSMHPNYAPQGSGYQYPPPPNQNANTYQYLPEKQVQFGDGRQNGYTPQNYGSPYPQQQPQGQQGHPFPNGAIPAMQQVYGASHGKTSTPGYEASGLPYREDHRDDSRSRSRSRSRGGDQSRKHHHHHHHHHNPVRPEQKRKGSGVSTFLGAGAGSLIGDAIFPGLGTIGGAILGGVGGHKYEKERRSYSNDREYYEENQRRGRRKYEERR